MEMKTVTLDDYRFLYDILLEREHYVNISHRVMPTFEEHIKFCNSNPYPHRYIIWIGSERVGTWYLTDHNEIGIFISKKYQGHGYGTETMHYIIDLFRDRQLLANVNPSNFISKKLFSRFKFSKIQETFCLEKGA